MITKALGTCSKCGSSAQVDIYNSINVDNNPELKDAVKSGSIFTWCCPECGALNLLKYQTLYHDPQQKLMIWLTDNQTAVGERIEKLFSSSDELSGYTARLVHSAGELIEKVKIFEAGLDDITMEICKLVTCAELEKDMDLKFLKLEGPDNEITFTYPENGQMQMLAIGFNVYEDARGIVSRNKELQSPGIGFVKVDKLWISTIIG